MTELHLALGESRGFWRHHTPEPKYKQAKAADNINNEYTTMLFDPGAEGLVIDLNFLRNAGSMINLNQTGDGVGIGESAYLTIGRTRYRSTWTLYK